MVQLPQEIIDIIFLLFDYNTLNSCRSLQNDYVTKCTKYNDLYSAISTKNISNEKWLRQQGVTYISSLSEAILSNCDIDTLDLMYADGCIWDRDTFEIAAHNGDLKVLKWLKDKGHSVSSTIFHSVHLNIDIIKWLMEINIPITASIFETTILKGTSIETLKWLHITFPYITQDHRCVENAIRIGNLEILNWLIDIGHEIRECCFYIPGNSKEITNFLVKKYRKGSK
jgi:hypothetical protein